jgi:hypothetical protein
MRRLVLSLAVLVALTRWSARASAMAVWAWGLGPGVEIWQEDRDEMREPRLPSRIYALDCPDVEGESFDRPVLLRCAVARQLPVRRVYLRYRATWRDAYVEVEMMKTAKGWYQARIPRAALSGMSVQFYFEGRDVHGEAVVRSGSSDKPNAVTVKHDPPPCPECPHDPGPSWDRRAD